jgi:uncharacterized repeat protein (TIGR03803 family)
VAVFSIFLTLLLAMALAAQAQAQSFKVLHAFHGTDGADLDGLLVRDEAGNLYGTAEVGGTGKGLCVNFREGCGSAFKLNSEGKLLWSHSFNFTNGALPFVGLTRDPVGHLYGSTMNGGNTKCYQDGCGLVFELDGTGKSERVLHKFTGGSDGMFPEPLLARDAAGNLYGTTWTPNGNIFKIDTKGKLTVLYTFTSFVYCQPNWGVILDAAGNMYGTASSCSDAPDGIVYELDTAGNLIILHTFGGSDGAEPDSALIFDSSGNLYGTTYSGGTGQECMGGCGTVFKLSPNGGGTWGESVLYNFCSLSGCADGYEPGSGPLAMGPAGNFYGTTSSGGGSGCGGAGCGVVYKLDSSGHETVLHTFSGGKDGSRPFAGLVMDKAGNLYGTTDGGGDASCPLNAGNGCGVVFRITP